MLVLTLRPTVFLLGIGSRGFPAASVLRVACTRDYGAEPAHLEAKVAKVRPFSLRRVGRAPPVPAAASSRAGRGTARREHARSPVRRTAAAGCGRGPRRRPAPGGPPTPRSSRRAAG